MYCTASASIKVSVEIPVSIPDNPAVSNIMPATPVIAWMSETNTS